MKPSRFNIHCPSSRCSFNTEGTCTHGGDILLRSVQDSLLDEVYLHCETSDGKKIIKKNGMHVICPFVACVNNSIGYQGDNHLGFCVRRTQSQSLQFEIPLPAVLSSCDVF